MVWALDLGAKLCGLVMLVPNENDRFESSGLGWRGFWGLLEFWESLLGLVCKNLSAFLSFMPATMFSKKCVCLKSICLLVGYRFRAHHLISDQPSVMKKLGVVKPVFRPLHPLTLAFLSIKSSTKRIFGLLVSTTRNLDIHIEN